MIVQNGWIYGGIYTDDGVSGANQKNRGGLQVLMSDARRKKFGIVIAKSVSRLGRNMRENLNTAHELETLLGLRLLLPEEQYDTHNNTSKLSFHLKAMLAEEESAKMSQRIKLGRQASALRGRLTMSLAPFGYHKCSSGKLVLDGTYAPIVREIFNLYLYEGWGWCRIKNELNRRMVPTPRTVSGAKNAGTLWHDSSIRVILENIVYTGNLVQHRDETIDFITKKRRKVPLEKQIVNQNTHVALITYDEHLATLEKMRTKGKRNSNGQEAYSLISQSVLIVERV